jgi:hypothetical protein
MVSSLPTTHEQLELTNRRQRLDIQMQKFEDAASTFVSDEATNDGWPDDEDA